MKRYNKHSSSGRSMLELIAILAILGVVAVGVYGSASNLLNKRKVVDSITKLHNIESRVRETFSWMDTYVVSSSINEYYGSYTDIEDYLSGQDIFSQSDLRLASGAKIDITSDARNGDYPSTFTLTFNADYRLCSAIKMEDWGDNFMAGIDITCSKSVANSIALTFK